MPRRQESLLEDLIYMHWSVSIALSVIAYVGLAVDLPQYCAGDACGLAFRPLVSTLATFAPFVALLLLIPAPLSALRARKKAPVAGPAAGLGINSEIALEGFRGPPRRVLSAAGFQRGRKPARGRGRWSRPPAQRQKRFTRYSMQTVAQAAGQRLNCQGVVRRDGRPGCLSRERRHFWNLHRGSRAIRRGQAHGTCRWGAAGAHDQGSWWRQRGEFASAQHRVCGERHPMPALRIATCSEESTARPSRGIGVLWLFVVSEVQLHQA